MKKLWYIGLISLLITFLFASLPFTHAYATNPDIIVQYHVWYDTPYGPESQIYPRSARQRDGILWGLWDTRRAEGGDAGSPDIIRTDKWSRTSVATPNSYPTIGLYDPDDPEILRWHIRLAKAAGIKAFAVSAYAWRVDFNGTNQVTLESKRLIEIFRTFLRIAQEEHFYLAWEFWWGGPMDFSQYKDIFQHPNYFRVYGKPLFWIAPNVAPYNFFGNSIHEFDQIANSIETQLGFPLYWALMANHPNMDTTQSTKSIITTTEENIRTATSNTQWPTTIRNFRTSAPGKLIGTHIYPGFNDSILTKRISPRIYSRYEGATLTSALQSSITAGADYIFLESWNDFSEGTAIEPGVKEDFFSGRYQKDYYKDLKIIAEIFGNSFVPPPYPPASSVDPIARANLGYTDRQGDYN